MRLNSGFVYTCVESHSDDNSFIRQAVSQAASQAESQAASKAAGQPVSRAVMQPVQLPGCKTDRTTGCLSSSLSGGQPGSQSGSQSGRQSSSQSVSLAPVRLPGCKTDRPTGCPPNSLSGRQPVRQSVLQPVGQNVCAAGQRSQSHFYRNRPAYRRTDSTLYTFLIISKLKYPRTSWSRVNNIRVFLSEQKLGRSLHYAARALRTAGM